MIMEKTNCRCGWNGDAAGRDAGIAEAGRLHAARAAAARLASAVAHSAAARVRSRLSAAVVDINAELAKAHAWETYDKIQISSLKELGETGEIKGYEVYLVNLNKKVWVSHFDMEQLKHWSINNA